MKVSYQLCGQKLTRQQCLRAQETHVTSAWTCYLCCYSYSVRLSCACQLSVWCSAEKRLVTVGQSSVYKAWAHTSCLSLNLSFDVIGRENRLLDRASFHQIKWHHERQHRILALRHKDYLQDQRERFRITWITYKRWSWSSSCGNTQERW